MVLLTITGSAQADLIGHTIQADYFYLNPFYGNWTSIINGSLLDPPEEQPASQPVSAIVDDDIEFSFARSDASFAFTIDFVGDQIVIVPTWSRPSVLFENLRFEFTSQQGFNLQGLTYTAPVNQPENADIFYEYDENSITIELRGVQDVDNDNEYQFMFSSSHPVPEPASATILGLGIAFLFIFRKHYI